MSEKIDGEARAFINNVKMVANSKTESELKDAINYFLPGLDINNCHVEWGQKDSGTIREKGLHFIADKRSVVHISKIKESEFIDEGKIFVRTDAGIYVSDEARKKIQEALSADLKSLSSSTLEAI